MKFNRSAWLLLIVGVALRCVAINQPLLDAHLSRQCQTAAATKSLIEQPGFHLSSTIPWLGDIDAHYVQELPVYNYLVIGMNRAIHHLDVSGKLTSILLWAASFLCLQSIWRRFLNPQETLWANLLFVVAPLSVFFGQAFMPEMLVQLLAFAFIVLALRYDECPSLVRWWICAGVGICALAVKLPETAHLYLILLLLIVRRESWRAFLRPRYWFAVAVTIVALKTWSSYVDSVNMAYLPEWVSTENLRRFIGTIESRLHYKPWTMVILYILAFVAPGPAAIAIIYGLWHFLRKQRARVLGLWLVSLAGFYILWFGNTAVAQSYYNLPALGPMCALFGIGVAALLTLPSLAAYPRTTTTVALLLLVLPAVPVWGHLFKQDRQTLAAALWTKANTRPNEIILFRPNHQWSAVDYPYNAALAYYSERLTFVWTVNTPESIRRAALERASYAVVTMPPPPSKGIVEFVNRFRGVTGWKPEDMSWLEHNGFRCVANQAEFIAFKRE
jgi:hypothetical protein